LPLSNTSVKGLIDQRGFLGSTVNDSNIDAKNGECAMNPGKFAGLGLAVAVAAAVVVPALAQPTGPIAQRQALMKQNGKDTKAAFAMVKGEVPYDAAKAAMIFAGMHDVASKYGALFPKGSETGGDTEAAPAIWSKPAEFKAAVAKFEADTKKATDAKPATLDAFKPLLFAATANCKSCHEAFRVDKP
jgi:cytochrome c556